MEFEASSRCILVKVMVRVCRGQRAEKRREGVGDDDGMMQLQFARVKKRLG
jgi:hypothetical protein